MKQQMAELMRFIKTGKVVEGESFMEDPQFPLGINLIRYPQAAGNSSRAREGLTEGQFHSLEGYPTTTVPTQHFTNTG